MEDIGAQRGIWDGDAKVVQQCLTDIFTSVYTTCDIPANAIFGPCILSHTSLYDSIAFIALKSTDKRTVPYIFRVDTSAANGSSEGLMWLRLVQSARDKEEQNLEAYIKNGQLFYRSLRRIVKDEELLVWYGKELTDLLLLSPTRTQNKMNGCSPHTCRECGQRSQFEFPHAAHVRFRCPKRLQRPEEPLEGANTNQQLQQPKYRTAPAPSQGDTKPTTDFHNLARDLENSRPQQRPPVPESPQPAKRKGADEGLEQGARFPAEELVCSPQSFRPSAYYSLEESGRRLYAPPSPETGEAKRSAFVEVKRGATVSSTAAVAEQGEDRELSPAPSSSSASSSTLGEPVPEGSAALTCSSTSAFSSVQRLASSDERKSAFSQPARSPYGHAPLQGLVPKLLPAAGAGLECHVVGDGPARIYHADSLAAKLSGAAAELGGAGGGAGGGVGVSKRSPFLYATAFWPKSSPAAAGPLQLQLPSTLTLLPPSFTSLCLPAQNWCAKCNASFRMTSDLVYHMRSHHKKEYAMEPLVKRRREEKLKCPICNESFRERHHLSRHMTSHN
ncbi:PR domain zinc finger protein 8 [Microcaecilia unicolor]|uniref:PR domain zinc finger protein 8 n=1 Tax=Microcaecilia unicolor TaxID=1415580 RepID=A0A6P7XCL3_9AMPH|nr:PR domain zinc finger protein 8-like [Microcaecilia unicolor]